MSRSSKRSFVQFAGWGSLALIAALAGCSKKEETTTTAVTVPASAPMAAAPGSTAASGPLKIAFAYVGPVGDGGWTFAHDNARKALERELGDKIQTSFVEKVPEGADAERVFRDMASQGNMLIFGTTFGYMEPMLKAAADLPDVKFEHATGYKTAPNMNTYDSRTYEGAYMAGVIAGGMTKTNVLGVVGSVPIPEVIRNIDSFTMGAQSVNPKIKTRVVWVNEWFNPPKETDAAQSLINGGADVLMQNTDSSAVLQTAGKAGKYAFGWDSDMKAYAPDAHLASSIINWAPYYIKTTKAVLDGTWKGDSRAWWGVKEGAIDIVSISDKVPADLKAKLDTVKAGLKDGSFVIWKGPITSNEGKEVVAAGVTADDKFLGGINFFVKGVEGNVPGGDKK
jgi:basic membrane protein A